MTIGVDSVIYPLAPVQAEIWLAQQIDPHSPVYKVAQFTVIDGPIEPVIFEAALRQVVEEAQSVRLQFINSGDGVKQFVASPKWTLTTFDFSAELDPQAAAEAWMKADYEKPVDLFNGSLFGYALLKVAADKFLWYQLNHHITMDGFGRSLITQRVADVYSAMVEGQAVTPCPFGTLSQLLQSEAQYRASQQSTEDRAYWLERCSDLPEPVTLASRRAPASHDSLRHTTYLAPSYLQGFGASQSFARDVAAFSTASMAAYLYRLTGMQDVVIGFPVTARSTVERSIPGMVTTTLPIRLSVQPNMSLMSLMEQTTQEIRHTLKHQRYPGEVLRRDLALAPHQRLFDVIINIVPFNHDVSFGGHLSTLHTIETGPVEDLSVRIYPQSNNQNLRIDFNANPACYTSAELIAHQRRFLRFLERLATNPNQSINEIDLLDAAERQQLLIEWNATASPYPEHDCLHQLFEAQVERTPDAVALIREEQSISYAQLNAQANRLAHYLQGLGVQPDNCVALYAQPSLEMVVGMLAILKAGGAYVPLDPNYPIERLTEMVADSAPVALLSIGVPHAAVTACLGKDVPVIDLQADAARWQYASKQNPQVFGLHAKHLTYVIYTSGSTGRPKGVMVTHQGVVNLVTAMAERLELSSQDRMLQFASLSFDVSVEEVFVTLTRGAALVLRTDAWLAGAQQFWSLCDANQISVMDVPVQFWAQLAQEQVPAAQSVRAILIGGDALSASARQAWFGGTGYRPRLLNVYGPTETTISSTVHEVTADDNRWRIIGRPIANTRLYVLDEAMRLVPLGEIGELYIGGAGVARGYLNRPELTAERFLPDTFSDQADAWMYKTGDLVRYLPDGNLEFLGRNDHQVKIRGFRVEPGEIETCLTESPQVREAVVLALEEGSAKRLIAYVVAEPDEQLVHSLRAHLAARLPEYMVPAAFVRLNELPLTPNGKLDRRALPAPNDEAFARQAYEAPQGEIEATLANIWAELLGIERVSRHDNFFALGGHSLLAVRLMNRVAAVGSELPLSVLFAAPNLAAFAAAVSECLAQAKNFLPAIKPLPRDGALPLSFAQQRLWFLAQFDGVSDIYHISLAFRLKGKLDRAAWQHALNTLFARHEALRSRFTTIDGQPKVQLLSPELELPLHWHDLRGSPDAHEQLERLNAKEAQAPFNLEKGPLIRARLIQLKDDEHVFLLTQHHIVSDGWSIEVLVRELSALYAAYLAGKPNPLPPLAIQYPDYAAWQRQWLSGERLQTQSSYWRTALANAPVLIDLPSDRPRPPRQSFAGARVPIRLNAQMTRALKQLSQKHGVTLFMTLLAAWGAVLSRLSGQDDMVIGIPSANRGHPEIESLIGFFVNTLALRIDLAGAPNTVKLLERIQHSTLSAQAHQDLPFEQVVEIVQPPRKLDHTPLFQVMFAWQNHEASVWCLPALEVTPVTLNREITVKFDLELGLQEIGDEIIGELLYATSLFDHQTIERQVGYLHTMLQAMTDDATRSITQIDLLAPAERALLLQTWNETTAPYPVHLCLHQLFEAQVERTPDAVALIREEQSISYAELNTQANRLAHYLRELGIQPDSHVALYAQPSLQMVVGILAILKAGGVYVPLDPNYPAERLTDMVADSAPVAVLSIGTPDAAVTWCLDNNVPTVDLQADAALWRYGSDENPHPLGLNAKHLAYVIYTSGSTGLPKGVMVTHQGVVNLVAAIADRLELSAQDRVLQFASLSFDVSIGEVFTTLTRGAALVLRTEAWLAGAQQFWSLCEANQISVMDLPVQFWSQLAQEQVPAAQSVRVIIIGGDALSASARQAWFNGTGYRPRILNIYGPTETTIGSTVHEVTADDNRWRLIGKPIANTYLYVLDAARQLTPLGAVGELYIGGVGVARGYLNRPELTTERFLPDPFADQADARMYKTGDLVRYLPDGNLEFLGRNDHQVKLRGFRVEPGEIEACLTEHPQVHEAVVLALGGGSTKRLVAYVVTEPDEHLAHSLRAHVAAGLPAYMVPAAFVRLDAFPLTPNGKLDRKALPEPDQAAFAHQAYEAPQGEIETALARIWAELLGLEQVSRQDNFFELGGHSLLAVQMIERLRHFGLKLPVKALFSTPTLSMLAQSLDQQQEEVVVPPNLITPDTTKLIPELLPLIDLTQSDIDQIVSQTPGGIANIQDIYALSPLQDGIFFHHLLATAGDPYLYISQLRFANRGLLERYLEAVQQVVNRHDILRTAFFWEHLSTPAQVVLRHAPVSVTELALDSAHGSIAEQLRQRFDPGHHRIALTQAPLLYFVVAQDTDGSWLMVQLVHHLVGDHSSTELMHAEEHAFLKGQGGALPEPQPFRHLIAQVRLSSNWQTHESFFSKMLADIEEPTLPFGLSDVHLNGSQLKESSRLLPQALNDRLRTQAKRVGVSLASLCHLAWARVLAHTSGQPQVVFGTVLLGRMQSGREIDRAMGLFMNVLPLRIDLNDASVEHSVRETHARLAALLEHEHASLALAQRCSHVPAGTPLFSALLNYRHNTVQSGEEQTIPGMELLYVEERDNYPLGLSVEDSGQSLGLTAQIVQPFEPEQVCDYMQKTLESLAEALERAPQMQVRQLETVPDAERALLLQTWNATTKSYPTHQCLHELFEAQVACAPHAVALILEEQSISYTELNLRANRLAHRLIDLGVGPDSRVALYAPPSIEVIIGMLAVLKAGGAYVPLDPNYPTERLVDMVKDSTPVVLLSIDAPHAMVVHCLNADVPILDLLADVAQWQHHSTRNPAPYKLALNTEHLAYVMYTSGSTGRPKGVMAQHRSVVNLVSAIAEQLDIRPQDRMLQFASLSFDVSIEEVFVTLTRGATLVLRTDAWLAGAEQFWSLCEASQISMLDLPMQLWAQLAQAQLPVAPCVRAIIIGGEALSAVACQAWFAGAGHRPRLLNVYGPTETTISSTVHEVTADDNRRCLIGKPIANTYLYVLDAARQLVPLGAVGELYIGGVGVARGYLNRPDLTAERFLPDPFSDQTDAWMYKTGDLVRYLPDGNLEFLGRNDHQVKIRGFRVEPGEIEAHLAEHPQVREARVLALGEGSAKLLVAYVVAEPDEHLVHTLRTHVAAALPAYMVPAAFVRLDTFPLTPNGKLDRQALPAPDQAAFAQQAYAAPQGETETALARIWSELLEIERISRHDNFFALGGHSLLAVRMISQSQAVLNVKIALLALFKAPTIAELAQRLSERSETQDDSFSVLLPIRTKGSRPPLFCIHPVSGLSWGYKSLANYLDADQPVYGLQARGLSGVSSLPETIEAMAADYIHQIRSIQPEGPYYLLGWSLGGHVAHSMATQLEQQGEKVALLAVLDSYPMHVEWEGNIEPEPADYSKILARYGNQNMPEVRGYLWERTQNVIKNNHQILATFFPSIYCGNMLLFRATVPESKSISSPSGDLWKPYVLGDIEAYDLDCQHSDMDRPAFASEIGRVITQKLNELQETLAT